MLRLEHVNAGYGETQVLWDVTLEAKKGEVTVIVGPNGAGKSTLLKVINGLIRPYLAELAPASGSGAALERMASLPRFGLLRSWHSIENAKDAPTSRGKILFNERDITYMPAFQRTAMGIASCPEGRRLFPAMTTEANLRLGAYPARARPEVEQTLEYVYGLFPRLRERAAVSAGRLSGGEQQMVGIGRALMAKPSLLVLDEPSLGLAPIVITEIFEKIRELREAGLSILMVEQNAFQALRIADFGYVVQEGHILRSGPPSELLDLEQLRRAYFAIT